MPVPPAQPATGDRSVQGFTAGGGPALLPISTTSSAKLPTQSFDQPSLSVLKVLGFDAVPFSFNVANGVIDIPTPTFVFPNLPQRDNTQNPLSPFAVGQAVLEIEPKDHLMFMVLVQNLVAPGLINVGITPQAIDKNNVVMQGPFLGASTYQTFQALLSVTVSPGVSGVVSGIAVGLLLLSVG